ncbi:kinase phosphorylation protein-domain-containing protein [Mycena polygramma]|nr:kinase phosphorylation protein-domain-containing protein [Mycena polygramma]
MMFEPIRGGTRGGQAEFKWADVSADKDRENYLGHSINAPTGRWQKNKDVHWYNRDVKQTDAERVEEIRKIKEAEADALAVALGFEPAPKTVGAPAASSSGSPKAEEPDTAALEKAEKRRKKAERKEEKRAKKEQRRLERGEPDYDDRRRRDRSRSRSPVRRHMLPDRRDDRKHRRTPSLPRRSRSPPRPDVDYDAVHRERERERDRRRWDANSRREQPGSAQWGRR